MRIVLVAAMGLVLAAPASAARKTPYWASLSAGEVMLRTGPGRNFPADWLYKRRGLPVKVVKTYSIAHAEWRQIQDPDGTQGWVQANLLSEQRTGMIVGDVSPMYEKPDSASPLVWRAQTGVVGKISKCGDGWCRLDVGGRSGFIRTRNLYGIAAAETLP